MPLSIVVGGQYGSEGKGKVAHWLSKGDDVAALIRTGGPNAGHICVHNGKPYTFRQLPTGVLHGKMAIIGPGAVFSPEILIDEIDMVGAQRENIFIDSHAVAIDAKHINEEKTWRLSDKIGSTQTGTGAATLDRLRRAGQLRRAVDYPALAKRVTICDSIAVSRRLLDDGKRIILEGTQGFGLSLFHGPHYPFLTSRDTTAAGFLSEAGLSPMDVDDICLVLRAFPIRVNGHSGPLENEVDWDSVSKSAGHDVAEVTTVSQKLRRVGEFDPKIVRSAIIANKPTRLFLNHYDYIDPDFTKTGKLSDKGIDFLDTIAEQIGRGIDYVGTSPEDLERIHYL